MRGVSWMTWLDASHACDPSRLWLTSHLLLHILALTLSGHKEGKTVKEIIHAVSTGASESCFLLARIVERVEG